MSITVVAQPNTSPPRFDITIATSDGSTMTAVTLNRTARGVTTPARVQPLSGFSSRYVPEYEADWDTPTVFTAVLTTPTLGTVAYASGQITVTGDGIWMIHPLVPSASLRIDTRSVARMGLRAIGAVSRPSTSNRLRAIGASLPTQIRVGVRAASQTQLTHVTTTLAEEASMWALMNDQTPLLIRVPPAWGWGFEDGYYDVDGPAAERALQYGPDQQRVWTLPIFRVAPPAGDQQSTWSYGDLLAAFPDYPSVAAAYADYPSLTANIRR